MQKQRTMLLIGEADHLLDECQFHRQTLWIKNCKHALLDAEDIISTLAQERSEFDFREEAEFGFLLTKFREQIKETARLESILDSDGQHTILKLNRSYKIEGEGSE